jgi:PAS domain S-box-containing protein
MPHLAWITTADGAVSWFNQRWYDYTGTCPADALGWGWQRVHAPESWPTVLEQWQAALASGEPRDIETPLLGSDGRFRTFLIRVAPFVSASGKPDRWVGTATDVEALKQAACSLKRSEERLKDAQRIASLGSWEWDLATGTFTWSDQIFALFGLDVSDHPDPRDVFSRGVPPEDHARIEAITEAAIAGRGAYEIEHQVIWPDGSEHTLYERGEVIRDALGRAVHMTGTALDITERKATERHLAETNRALELQSRCNEALIRSTSEVELLATVCRIAVEEGGYFLAWVGYAEDDELKSVRPRAHFGAGSEFLATSSLSWSADTPFGHGPTGRAIRCGEPIVIPDLDQDPLLWPWLDMARSLGFRGVISLPLKNGEQVFGALVLTRSEVHLPEARELRVLRQLADNLAFGIVNLRSQAERRRLQLALEKVAASTSAATGDDFFEQLATSMVEALDAKAGFVARLLPGSPATARTVAAIVDGKALPGFDYLLAGTPCEALQSRDEWTVDADLIQRFPDAPRLAAQGARAYSGRRLDDAEGRPVGVLFVLFAEPLSSTTFVSSTLRIFATRAAVELARQDADAKLRDQASLLDKVQDAILVRDLDHRVLYWNESATRLYGLRADEALGLSVRELLYDDPTTFDAATKATIDHGEWLGELTQRRRDGSPLPVQGRWTLVRDRQGAPASILAVNSDLTERKKLERTEEQLRQAQKMEAIGSLAGGIAHDFNNLLTIIMSYAELAILTLPESDPLWGDLEQIKRAGERAAELTRQLLAFSRKQILRPVVLDLNQILANVEKMLRRLVGEHIELSVVTHRDLGPVHADAGQIEQVLLNLVVNARDAMPAGGRLLIETTNVSLDDAYAGEHPGVSPGPYVVLTVTDTGEGMDRVTRERMFEPFFTTKDKSNGTGLGLSTVYGIVQQSGGHIDVRSERGVGTTIEVHLRRTDRPVDSSASDHEHDRLAPRSLRGSETILLVEDDRDVRVVTATVLRKNGYSVLEAQNAGEAFLISEQLATPIRLLITDVVMPRMSGQQLAERLASSRPEMRVLYVSGHTDTTIEQRGLLDPTSAFLAKPLLPEPLLTRVRGLLDEGSPQPPQLVV